MTTSHAPSHSTGPSLSAGPAPGWRVLVVDGEPMIPQLLATQLTPHGFAVTAAGGVARAAVECRRCEFDLILLDLDLEQGAPLLERIAPGVPITFISADVDRERRVDRPGGAGVLLPKFQPNHVTVPRLRELCEGSAPAGGEPSEPVTLVGTGGTTHAV